MKRRLNILIVDDDEQGQRMLNIVLKTSGHEIKFASNGMEAFNAIRSQCFDLVFMDVQMPIMNGLEAALKIREWENGKQHLYIVGVTAALDDMVKKCMQAGMNYVISKPFNVNQIHEVIDACVNQGDLSNIRGPATVSSLEKDEPMLDIQGALKRFSGDRSNYSELLDEFISSLPGRFKELKTCLHTKNWQGLSGYAHNLKGLSASIGAMKLSRRAMELEQYVIIGWYGNLEEKLNEIGDDIHKLRSKTTDFLTLIQYDDNSVQGIGETHARTID